MGNRGPKPTPKTILRLRGSWRGKETIADLDDDHKMPVRPEEVQGYAKKCWEYIVPKLYKKGLATELSQYSLALMCWAWEDVVESRADLEDTRNEKGRRALLVKTGGGGTNSNKEKKPVTVSENPSLYTFNRALGQFNKLASCFGVTPADMAGVTKVEKPAKTESKAKFFKGL